MTRLGRFYLPDHPLHVIRRGNDRQAVFFTPGDYARYRDWLIEAADEYGCAVHAYVLMTNHAQRRACRQLKIAVGTCITERPPHRSARTAFPHAAPTLDDDADMLA